MWILLYLSSKNMKNSNIFIFVHLFNCKKRIWIFSFFCFCFNRISINIENEMKHDKNENDEIEKKNDTLKTNQMKMLQIIKKLFQRLQICKQKNYQNEQYKNFNSSKSNINIKFTFLSQFSILSSYLLKRFFCNEIQSSNVWIEKN